MRISEISIERPVLASVMSLLIVVAGVVAFLMLPVREYPDVDPPEVSVTTVYPGASPETVETTVTEPLEQVLNGIEGIRSIDSTSAFGRSSINVEFEAGRDIDVAATDVSNAILRAVDLLPALRTRSCGSISTETTTRPSTSRTSRTASCARPSSSCQEWPGR